MRHTLYILLASLCLGGCINRPHVDSASVDEAKIQLVEAAKSVSHSLNALAEVEQAAYPPKRVTPPLPAGRYGMDALASVDWSGPVEPLLHRLASASDYRMHVLGTPPAIPIITTITAHNIALADILRNVGYQCGTRANIVVFPSQKLIELRYTSS